jgi:hypothetical protein
LNDLSIGSIPEIKNDSNLIFVGGTDGNVVFRCKYRNIEMKLQIEIHFIDILFYPNDNKAKYLMSVTSNGIITLIDSVKGILIEKTIWRSYWNFLVLIKFNLGFTNSSFRCFIVRG